MKNNIPLGRIAEGEDIVKVIIFLASKRSKRITGQIIKVDGGRGLTSSGYVHYKGMLNMNSVIEPDKEILNENKINNLYCRNEVMEKPITDKEELKKFVENNIKKSNFSTRNYDAFFNVLNTYYPVDNNNNILSKKYLKNESKSGLLKLNSEKEVINIININNNINNISSISKEDNKSNNENNTIKVSQLKPDDEEIYLINNKNE